MAAGVPTEAIPTYCALADHADNKTGLCWPRMETLARRLSRSPRTVQRHLHLLKERGLVEFVERRRDGRGRFGAYLYRLLHVVAATARGKAKKGRAAATTTGQGGRVALRPTGAARGPGRARPTGRPEARGGGTPSGKGLRVALRPRKLPIILPGGAPPACPTVS